MYLGITKVEINGFSVSNVKNTIRFGWKTGPDLKQLKQIKFKNSDKLKYTQFSF